MINNKVPYKTGILNSFERQLIKYYRLFFSGVVSCLNCSLFIVLYISVCLAT